MQDDKCKQGRLVLCSYPPDPGSVDGSRRGPTGRGPSMPASLCLAMRSRLGLRLCLGVNTGLAVPLGLGTLSWANPLQPSSAYAVSLHGQVFGAV